MADVMADDIEIRALTPDLTPAAQAFFSAIPEGDRTFFKEDVLDAATVAGWAHDTRSRRLVAVEEQSRRVVGYVAVIPGVGWSGHVGEIRLVIDPGVRRQGLGRRLARRALVEAIDLELGKVVVEVVADQVPAVELFLALGFEAEAVLCEHVCDRAGELRDLLVLAHRVDDIRAAMATTGIDEALGQPT